MVDMTENEDKRAVIKSKLRQNFDGKIVRKDFYHYLRRGSLIHDGGCCKGISGWKNDLCFPGRKYSRGADGMILTENEPAGFRLRAFSFALYYKVLINSSNRAFCFSVSVLHFAKSSRCSSVISTASPPSAKNCREKLC